MSLHSRMIVYRALLRVNMSLLRVCRTLLCVYRALWRTI